MQCLLFFIAYTQTEWALFDGEKTTALLISAQSHYWRLVTYTGVTYMTGEIIFIKVFSPY